MVKKMGPKLLKIIPVARDSQDVGDHATHVCIQIFLPEEVRRDISEVCERCTCKFSLYCSFIGVSFLTLSDRIRRLRKVKSI